MSWGRVVIGATLLDLALSALFAWDVFTGALAARSALGPGQLAAVFSAGLVGFTAGVLAGGRAADLSSPRRLGIAAASGLALGLAGCGVVTSLSLLVVSFGLLVGTSSGLGYAVAVRVAGTVSRRHGLALSIVVSAYAAGTVVIAPAAEVLLARTGVTRTFLLLGLVLGVLVLVGALLLPDAAPTPRAAQSASTAPGSPGVVPRMWLVFLLGAAPALAAFAHAGDIVGAPGRVSLAVALLGAGNLLGRLVAGPVSDAVGRLPALHANAALLVAVCTLLAATDRGTTVLAALTVLGVQYGALSVLVPALVGDVTWDREFGTTYGRIFTGWGAAGLLAPVTSALAADRVGWDGAFAAGTGVAVLGWAALATLAPARTRG